jgi:hypothetical protein
MMKALDQRDGQDPTCLPPNLLHSEVLSYLGKLWYVFVIKVVITIVW